MFSFVIMSSFLLKKKHMREALLFCFNLKKSPAESHRMLMKAYGDNALSETTCRDCFRRFNADNFEWQEAWKSAQEDWGLSIAGSFGRGRNRKKCLPSNWVFLKVAISMRLHVMGKVQKIGKWVPHELNDRQMERRQNTCHILLAIQKRKLFLHRIVTGDEKWIYFQNPKRKKSWVDPANHQHLPQDQIASDGRRCCVFGGIRSVIYYELLKPGKTINAHRYHQQLIKLHRALHEKRPHYRKRHDKLIFLRDNTPLHMSTMVQNYLETLNWEVLLHPAYSPDLAPSDYHLFSSMGHVRWAALRFLRRRPKMAWWVVCLERWGIFLAWYTQIAQKVGKMYS